MKYNLESSQSDRSNFDQMLERMADATLISIQNEIENIKKCADEYIADVWESEKEFFDVDDIEEAFARFSIVYRDAITNA